MGVIRRPRERPLVLHVIPHLWSGAGSVVTRLCETQRRLGPVAIVTAGSGGEHPDWPSYRARLRRAGVTHHTIDFFHRTDGQFWTSVAELAALLREIRPGIVHAHAGVPACGAVAARAMSGQRARIIGQMYSWGPDRPEWMNTQDTWGLGQTDRVICSARAYWDLLVRYGLPVRKLTYLPWGLPLDRLPWRRELRARRRPPAPLIGFVGRVEPRKGQLDLISAFARMHAAYPGARLELIGPVADEGYAARVREAVHHHNLADVVTLTGEVRQISAYVRRWDLFVSLSADEGQGLAVLEAMAIGVPVVARPVAGIADFLTDGRTGFAVRDASIEAATTAMRRAWSDPARARRVAVAARRLVERRYAWESTIAAFERLYWRSR